MNKTPRSTLSDEEFEAEVRAMLVRRSADVSPSATARLRPTTAANPTGRSAHDGVDGLEPISLTHRHSTPRHIYRMLVGAAAAVIVITTVIALRDTGDGHNRTTTAATTTPVPGTVIPAPGMPGWDAASAPPVWPIVGHAAIGPLRNKPAELASILSAPDRAAAAYLGDVAALLLKVDPSGSSIDDQRTARVRWVFGEAGEPQELGGYGYIHLRNIGDREAPLWVVVGATTERLGTTGISLADVRIFGGRLSFTVVAAPPTTGDSVSVRVGVNSDFVTTGGEPLPQGAVAPEARDPSSGELTRLSAGGQSKLDVSVSPGDVVDVLVRGVGGDFLSVTHMAVTVPNPPASSGQADPPSAADETNDVPADGSLATPIGPVDATGQVAVDAGRGTAVEVAAAYLDDRMPDRIEGLDVDPGAVTTEPAGGNDPGVVVVPWRITPPANVTSNDSPPIEDRYSGSIRLRQIEGGWAVVGAITDQIRVSDARREGNAVTVTIKRLDQDAIDGIELSVFDLAGRQVGEPEHVDFGLPGTYRIGLGTGTPPDALTVRARHVGGTWFSLTEVRVVPASGVSPGA